MKGFFIILACSLWALDTLIRYPLMGQGSSALVIVFFEHVLCLMALSLFLSKSYQYIFKLKYLWSFLIIGSLGSALSTVAFTKSFEILNPSVVILLQKLQPLVALSLSSYVLGERIGRSFLFWVFISLLGAILIGYDDLYLYFESLNESNEAYQYKFDGYLYVFISVIGWGCATVYGKKLSMMGLREKDIMLGRFFFGAMALLPFCFQANFLNGVDLDFLSKVSILVVLSAIIGMYFYYKGLKSVPAKVATLLELFFPFTAVAVNWLFLGQSISLTQWIGGGLLALSATVVQIKRF